MNTAFDPSNIRIVLHGGAGDLAADAGPQTAQREALHAITAATLQRLNSGCSAIDAVEFAVLQLEQCPLFNAGIGGVLNRDGLPELDAAIMCGRDRNCGAVSGVMRIQSPIQLARAVMERSPHVFFSGEGAEKLGQELGLAVVEPSYFIIPERVRQLQAAQKHGVIALDHDTAFESAPDPAFGTVGAVVRDGFGSLAAATSTGGLTNKHQGRIGDTPVIGAGTFADNESLAVSCTGTGESFIRVVFGHELHARMRYSGWSLAQAAQHGIDEVARYQGRGGCIAIDYAGNMAMPFNAGVMYRAWLDAEGHICVAIGTNDTATH